MSSHPSDESNPHLHARVDSPWSIEHYGFEHEAASDRRTPQEKAEPAPAPAALARRRASARRLLLGSAALVVGLVGGTAGYAVAGTDDGDSFGHVSIAPGVQGNHHGPVHGQGRGR